MDSHIIDLHAPLGHHLLKFTVAYSIAAAAPDRPKHDIVLELAAREHVHRLPPLSIAGMLAAVDGICNGAKARI